MFTFSISLRLHLHSLKIRPLTVAGEWFSLQPLYGTLYVPILKLSLPEDCT